MKSHDSLSPKELLAINALAIEALTLTRFLGRLYVDVVIHKNGERLVCSDSNVFTVNEVVGKESERPKKYPGKNSRCTCRPFRVPAFARVIRR
jgi:hypothetical protein